MGGLAINWAVNCFVIVLMVFIVLALEAPGISFSKEFLIAGLSAIFIHGLIIYWYARSTKWRKGKLMEDTKAVKMLEYTVSIVCWTLQLLLWFYGALDAGVTLLFIPTYFVTSLMLFHIFFRQMMGFKVNKNVLFFLLANFYSLGHAIFIVWKARESLGAK